MSEEQRTDGTEQLKVVDRRRFTADGEPIEAASPDAAGPVVGGAEAGAAGGEAAPAADPRDAVIAQQAARIDELMRAYASLVDEGRAARARIERERTRVLEAERAQIIQVLLEAADELERARAATQGATGPLAEGVDLTLASLAKRVAELGAQRLSVVGERFDPRLHEAIDVVPVAEATQDEMVVQEVRAGYRMGDRVLRPARVRVGRLARA